MSLIKCPECGKENVSDSAESCPNCGFGIKAYFEKIKREEEKQVALENYRKEQEAKKEQGIYHLITQKRPKFSVGFIVYMIIAFIFFTWLMLYTPTTYGEDPDVFKWVLELLVFIGIPLAFYLPFYNKQIKEYEYQFYHPEEYLEKQEEEGKRYYDSLQKRVSNLPKCPSCGSTNISNIGFGERAVSTGLWGINSKKIGKTHKCNNCGNMW